MVISYAMPSDVAPAPAPSLRTPLPRPVVFDLRDRSGTGLARVATETVAAWQRCFPDDPVRLLTEGGGRYSLRAQWEWRTLRRRYPDATWVWFHWDIPWFDVPQRSVVYVHDRIHAAESRWPRRALAERWIAHALRCAGAVVTVSEATARLLPPGAVVIPNGVTLPTTTWHPRDYLLTVGEPRAYKNFSMASRVAAALGMAHRHAWRVTEQELATLYAEARVVLVPSRAEGFGLPLLEAFAVGAPVVASDIPALVEVSGGLATHVAPDDVEGWCRAVRAAWDAPGDPLVRQARAREFRWERAARQLRDVVRSLG
jgi:glycosyltransferase involved in cell wall biosynthesis